MGGLADSPSPQHEPVLTAAGGGVVATTEPHVRTDLAKFVADVAEDAGVRGVLHDEARRAVEPARLHMRTGGNGVHTAEPAVGHGPVAVKGFPLPEDPLQPS